MENGLNLLGADDLFASQYITIRIKSIDREKLKQKLGGSTGSIANSALTLIDFAPRAALDAAMPLVKKAAVDYGAELEVVVANVPPSKGGRALSEFWPGLVAGMVLGGSSLLIVKGIARLFGR